MSANGAYANPTSYDSPDLEREVLAGRIVTARKIRDLHAPTSARFRSWQETVDRLLEHYSNADLRAELADVAS